jgi:hypothetical protein
MTANDTPADPRLITEIGMALARGGLPVSGPEIAKLVAGYHLQNVGVEMLYAVPEARYADPGLRFQAGARIVDWSE